ncbi:hypothetical protein NG895_07705 [Aeoliella sp. ICT_H6.2]|uniref:Sigma 54 modulation/S30EA-like ribosomal protein n=1 Tax=Aeoliella straminimaris TaxID=2954799 RepID=A0A9X2FCI5_9BACT|nr:HPF/RaiA family ribosome-associated protein [Aeoliella straminimaris]MCO6043789.1 hypothetical protein [Aeoliella straminimaris]
MQVKINSDNHIDVHEKSVEKWQDEVATALSRFGDWLTRVEVHLTDENSHAKGGPDDIRCLMEARPAGKSPVSIEVRAANVDQAVHQATATLERRLATMVDKARTERRKRPAQIQPSDLDETDDS